MNRIVPLVLLLMALAWWGIEAGPPPPSEPDGPAWRRTVDGWERADLWNPPRPEEPSAPHPLVVGTLLALASCWSLLAFSARRDDTDDDPQGSS